MEQAQRAGVEKGNSGRRRYSASRGGRRDWTRSSAVHDVPLRRGRAGEVEGRLGRGE